MSSDAHLWENGRVFTGRRLAESLLVEEGRVVVVGRRDEVRRAAPVGTERHDLGGRLLLPGLIDAHLHLLEIARIHDRLNVRGIPSFERLSECIRTWAAEHPGGAVVGAGWESEQFREGRPPPREVLDRGEAGRPVVLYHTSGHSAAVNGAALERVGIGRTTPDPPDGRVERDPDGTPTGILHEGAMRAIGALVASEQPPVPDALKRTFSELAAFGLTTVASMNAGREEARTLRDVAETSGPLPRVRVYVRLAGLPEFPSTELARPDPTGRFGVVGVKAFTDGAFGPRTAWLSAPYSDRPGETGMSIGNEPELASAIEAAARKGLAPALHAIGDRAVDRSLRLLAPWVGRTPSPGRIEHAALTPPELFGKLDQVRPALIVQPGFIWSDAWLRERLGPERARWAYAFRTLLVRGHLVAGSSDAPFDLLDPFRGLAACVDRRDPLARSANPTSEEALSAEEALVLYSVNGGRAIGEPDLGSLEPGSRADLIIMDAPDAARAIASGREGLLETWVGGHRVYSREPGTRSPQP